jgi:hypothetical protein
MALRLRGIGSQLIVPIQCGVEMVAALEMSGHRERPWSRFEISRTRLIADQLGPVLDRTHAPPAEAFAPVLRRSA